MRNNNKDVFPDLLFRNENKGILEEEDSRSMQRQRNSPRSESALFPNVTAVSEK